MNLHFFTSLEVRARSPRGFVLALCWMLLFGLCAPVQAKRIALVIGNDQYASVEKLKNARNDARLIASVLTKAGFGVTQANDLGREGLWSTIDAFKSNIGKGDEVVFYFAGHGVQIGSTQLLLPTDINPKSEAQVQRDGVPLIEVQDAFKDARVAIFIIDACRDNPFPKQGTRTLGASRGMLPPEPSSGQIIMLSAGRNQKALDQVPGQNVSNSLFTWELAQAIQNPGMEVRSALERVKDLVDDKARAAQHEQRPSLVNDLRGNFYFFGPTTVIVGPQAPAKPEAVAPSVRPGQVQGLSLADLEREEATRKEWTDWQGRMKADFDKTAAFAGSADLMAKAWERFLVAWAQDNPMSTQDEALRGQALVKRDAARQASAQAAPSAPATARPPAPRPDPAVIRREVQAEIDAKVKAEVEASLQRQQKAIKDAAPPSVTPPRPPPPNPVPPTPPSVTPPLAPVQPAITSPSGGSGNTQQAAGPSASYAGRVRAKLKPNLVLFEETRAQISGNPEAEVEVKASADGSITERKLIKSSGVKAWDDAVLRAIDKTETLPRDVDGRVPSPLVLSFRPKD